MANGYVPNPFLARYPPWHPLRQQHLAQYHQQLLQQEQQQRAVQPNPNDPAAIFGFSSAAGAAAGRLQQEQQCFLPPAYFPAQGPNIFQLFWIRLFWLCIWPFTTSYSYSKAVYARLLDVVALLLSFGGDESDESRMILMSLVLDNRWSLLIGLVVILVLSGLAWVFSPKGENNT